MRVRTTSYSPGTTNVTVSLDLDLDENEAAEMFLEQIEVTQQGITIQLNSGLQKNFESMPAYLNSYFKGFRLFIPKDADLSKYKFDGPDELSASTFSNHSLAFIAAFPMDVNRKGLDYNYRFLYLDSIGKDNTAIFKIQNVYKIKNNSNIRHSIPKSFRVKNILKKNTHP